VQNMVPRIHSWQARFGPDEQIVWLKKPRCLTEISMRHLERVMRLVGAWRLLNLGAVSRPEGVERSIHVNTLVGVSTEEVALTLNQGRT
jgi:hypothetical protein